MVEQRLARIESKVDRMVEAIERITRIEERQALSVDGIKRMSRKLDAHEERLSKVETAVAVGGAKLGAGERLFWVLLASGMSIITWVVTQ